MQWCLKGHTTGSACFSPLTANCFFALRLTKLLISLLCFGNGEVYFLLFQADVGGSLHFNSTSINVKYTLDVKNWNIDTHCYGPLLCCIALCISIMSELLCSVVAIPPASSFLAVSQSFCLTRLQMCTLLDTNTHTHILPLSHTIWVISVDPASAISRSQKKTALLWMFSFFRSSQTLGGHLGNSCLH